LAPTIPFVVRVDGADARLLVKQAT